MKRITQSSVALCASFAFGGCSPEETSEPALLVDASSNAGASGMGSHSATGGAGGGATGGAGNTGGLAGGSSAGSTAGTSDASGADEDPGPATRDGGNEAGDATIDAADAKSGCAGLFCEDFELGQIDSAKWNVQMAGGSTVAIEQQVVASRRRCVSTTSAARTSS
jgi:hypothetical protein